MKPSSDLNRNIEPTREYSPCDAVFKVKRRNFKCTGTYDHTFANIYPVGDAFRYLVEWMGDNQMTCSSPLFDTGGNLS